MIVSKNNSNTILKLLVNIPTISKKINWNEIQNADVTEYSKYPFTYYHTVDPNGNVVLFKKVILVTDSKLMYNTKNNKKEEEADKNTKTIISNEIGLFFPIGHYSLDQDNNYILTNTAMGNPIETLSRIDLSEMTNQKIIKIIGGFVSMEESSQLPATFSIEAFQEQMRTLLGLKEGQIPSMLEIRKVLNDHNFGTSISAIVGRQNRDLTIDKIKRMVEFIIGASELKQNKKLFQNGIFAAEPTLQSMFDPYDSSINIEATRQNTPQETQLGTRKEVAIRINKIFALSRNSVISMVKTWSNPKPHTGTVGEYLALRNRGELPKTFRDIINAFSTDINADPSFSYVTGLLVNKIGKQNIFWMTGSDFNELREKLKSEEITSSNKINTFNANMYYYSESKIIIINQNLKLDYRENKKAVLIEFISELTFNIFETNPAFKAVLILLVSEFNKAWNNENNIEFINELKIKYPKLFYTIQNKIIDKYDLDRENTTKEFLSYILTLFKVPLYKLKNMMEFSILTKKFDKGKFFGLTVKEAVMINANKIDWSKLDLEKFYLNNNCQILSDFEMSEFNDSDSFLREQYEIEEELSYSQEIDYDSSNDFDGELNSYKYYNFDLDPDQQSIEFWNSL